MTTPNPSEKPQLSPTEVRRFCRKAIALWLMKLANRIDQGEVDGFKLQWDVEMNSPRPLGQVIQDAQFVPGPIEEKLVRVPAEPEQQVKPKLSEERGPIPVEDLSEQMRDLEPCNEPECPNCKKG